MAARTTERGASFPVCSTSRRNLGLVTGAAVMGTALTIAVELNDA
jgi:hypothetical protein